MSGISPPGTKLDSDQVIRRVYDETENKLRVDAEVTAVIGIVEVIIDAAGGDNIAIASQDGTNYLNVNPDGTIDVNSHVSAPAGDSVVVAGTEDGTLGGTQHAITVDSEKNVHVTTLNSFITKPYNEIVAAYPNAITEQYTTKLAGTARQIITITYTDSSKTQLAGALRTDL
jgi:hypothetical protein